jgi:hypothetical protein
MTRIVQAPALGSQHLTAGIGSTTRDAESLPARPYTFNQLPRRAQPV